VSGLINLGAVQTVDIRRPDEQPCDRLSKISLKFFLDLSCVWTVLPCRSDGRTSAARNFHIKGMVVRTVDLMRAIFIYVAHASGP
jgi:hypothetical protein